MSSDSYLQHMPLPGHGNNYLNSRQRIKPASFISVNHALPEGTRRGAAGERSQHTGRRRRRQRGRCQVAGRGLPARLPTSLKIFAHRLNSKH
ncbi:hypothetical protein E2C01_008431 [Portunus trituberculatus]|uniref:Uncharacterized protein n=1 Tax=Portunus trituberculatus TaxID=210409 RepID=A0A5B7D5F0_PORTR|nr:hypothetical protein [Portunus trituberculatus]